MLLGNRSCATALMACLLYAAPAVAPNPVRRKPGGRSPWMLAGVAALLAACAVGGVIIQEGIKAGELTTRTVKDKDDLRAILAATRKQGYAATDQELEEGLRSLAVPIRDANASVVAALNVSVHASRASMAVLRRDFLPYARQAVAGIEADLTGVRGVRR